MKAKASLIQSKRDGAIIVLFAILLPVLVLILGFTVDYAYIQRSRNEVRVLSDLAVKAAADTLARTGGDEEAALAAARFVSENNTVAGKNITLNRDDIIFGRSYRQPDGSYQYFAGDTPANAVQVIARRDASTAEGSISSFFGAFYNRPTFDVAQQAQATFRDVEIMLVLDRSTSMKSNLVVSTNTMTTAERRCQIPSPTSRWIALDSAIDVFIKELRATPVRERIGMVTFSENSKGCNGVSIERVTLETPLNKNLHLVTLEMNRLKQEIWFGGTNITAGLQEARLHFADQGEENVEKVIICLTDGRHNADAVAFEQPSEEATTCREEGITVHTITFSDEANQDEMILTAQNGGGSHFHAPDQESLEQIFRDLAGSSAFISK